MSKRVIYAEIVPEAEAKWPQPAVVFGDGDDEAKAEKKAEKRLKKETDKGRTFTKKVKDK